MGHHLTHFDLGPLGDQSFQRAIAFGEDFGGDFVGLNLKKGVPGGDLVAIFLFQLPKTPEVMDSPTEGTLTGIDLEVAVLISFSCF